MTTNSYHDEQRCHAYLPVIISIALLGVMLFGYDIAIIFGAEKGLQAYFMNATDFEYTDNWHTFTKWSAIAGLVVGIVISYPIVARVSRKMMLIVAGLLLFVSALGCMQPEILFSPNSEPTKKLWLTFNAYRILGGVGIGIILVFCPIYITEITARRMRGWLVGSILSVIIIGIISALIVYSHILGQHIQPQVGEMGRGIAALNPAAQWTVTTGWRYIFGSEAIPAGLFALLACIIPETPQYLVNIGKRYQAKKILTMTNGREYAVQKLTKLNDKTKKGKEK